MTDNPFKNLKRKLEENDRFPFGKHQGEKVSRVSETDPSYILWWDREVHDWQIDPAIVDQAQDDSEQESWRRDH